MINTYPLWPSIVILCLWSGGLLLNLKTHGEPKKGNNSAWSSIVALVLTAFLLYKGGFFHQLIAE